MPTFVALLANHRPRSLYGQTLSEALEIEQRQPSRLQLLFQTWGGSPAQMRDASPSLVFAVIGQANADGKISPEEESRLLTSLLTYWALRGTLDMSAFCSQRTPAVTGAEASFHALDVRTAQVRRPASRSALQTHYATTTN